jgi:UDP-N-acetyl-D-glucosamine dehydrogenase
VNLVVIGQGYVGLPLAVKAAESGFSVYGFDIDKEKINDLNLGITNSPEVTKEEILKFIVKGALKFVSDPPKIHGSGIFVIAVPTPLDLNHKPDLSMLKSACEILSRIVTEDSLIINESTSYIGTLRNLIKPLIDEKSGYKSLLYAVAPERIDPGNTSWNMENTPRNISGLTKEATFKALEFYGNFCKYLNEVSKPEVAEAAKLFENTFRQINIALVNEFSEIASAYNFSAHETISAASTKPFGYMPFYPSIGVGGHCIPVDPTYLSYSAELVDKETKFINLANNINLFMPKFISKRIAEKLGGNLNGIRIQLAGIAYKPNVSDLRESPALTLIKELENLGAIVSWCDPLVNEFDSQKSVFLDPSVDLGLIVTPHSAIDFSIWKQGGTQVFDLSANSNNYGWPKFL